MNKFNLLLLVGAAALTGCASEDVINSGDINPPTGGQAMSFGMLTGNMSRAGMEAAGHKDFGVFAFKGDSYESGKVMANYQVLYSDTNPGDDKDTTWGDGSSSTNGSSYWYYEGARAGQILKYWDYSFNTHSFVAYTPYAASGVTFSGSTTYDLEMTGLKSFWTRAERDNSEAMWAKATVAKAAYGTDVALNFNHLNAVVRLAFRSNIPGYTVKLINLTSTDNGVQLTPATADQANDPINWTATDPAAPAPQPNLSQKYATKADFTVADVFGAATKTTNVVTEVSDNLVFHLSETAGAPDEPLAINAGADATYTKLGSQFFALPLSGYTGIHETGYTLHVSYVLIPNDGAATTTVHDARVFIPADKCKWAYGKAYTYNFTITTASSGVTDPNTKIYDDGTNGTNYVDPTDPRVPDTKALLPIVFDGVTVTDYATEEKENININ